MTIFTFPQWLSSWRSTTATTDPERCDDDSGTIGTENPKSKSSTPSTSTPSTTVSTSTPTISTETPTISTPTTSRRPMLTRFMAATAVGLQPSALLTPPTWAVAVYSALVQRFHNRLGYFHERGMNIGEQCGFFGNKMANVLRNPARGLLGPVTDPAPQGVGDGGDVGHGVIALPEGPRYRWVWSTIKFVVVLGALAFTATMLQKFARLPQSRAFYEELLEIMRYFKANALS